MSDRTPARSPCVSICALDENNICVGCYRTGEEITHWGSYLDSERHDILAKVAERERAAMNFTPINSVSKPQSE